jgi:hypothetical protein
MSPEVEQHHLPAIVAQLEALPIDVLALDFLGRHAFFGADLAGVCRRIAACATAAARRLVRRLIRTCAAASAAARERGIFTRSEASPATTTATDVAACAGVATATARRKLVIGRLELRRRLAIGLSDHGLLTVLHQVDAGNHSDTQHNDDCHGDPDDESDGRSGLLAATATPSRAPRLAIVVVIGINGATRAATGDGPFGLTIFVGDPVDGVALATADFLSRRQVFVQLGHDPAARAREAGWHGEPPAQNHGSGR